MSTDHDDQSDTPSGDLYTLEQLESPEKYIEPGVPDQHPSLSKPSAVCYIPPADLGRADHEQT